MESTRQKKISRLLQKEAAEMLQREMRDITLGAMVSITSARVSSDLSLVKFYMSVFPPARQNEVLESVKHNIRRIRYGLGQRTGKQLRIIPEPAFFIDDSLDYMERIDKLLEADAPKSNAPKTDAQETNA